MTGTIDHEQGSDRRFADELALAQQKVANLEAALATNRRIGIAIGIVMAAHRLTEEQAFDHLVDMSQRQQRKLRDVAEQVVLTGAT